MTSLRKIAIFNFSVRRMLFRHLLAGCLMALPHLSHGWSEAGHVVIAELAMDAVGRDNHRKLNELAQLLASQNKDDARRIQRYGSVSAVAQMASWIDGERSLTVEQIFKKYGQQVPIALRPFRHQTTSDWHYSNKPHFDEAGESERFKAACELRNSGQLNQMLPYLRAAFSNADSPEDKAIVLAMLVHFVSDAHQPLHGITRVTRGCSHDRGGNGFCIEDSKKGRCKDNLHHAWDSGFGLFDRRNFEQRLSDWSDSGSVRVTPGAGETLQPRQWQAENLSLAEAVYAAEEGEPLDEAYKDNARIIIRERVMLAAHRLAVLLTELARE